MSDLVKKLEKASDRVRKSEADDISLNSVFIAGQAHGIAFETMRKMTIGQIIDYCIEYENQRTRAERAEKKGTARKATQADINAFLGS